ncbi:MAG: hypothetical protein H0U25_06460, partial [Thermoleophilaceae bacterium]|nr:hypothetical protein [Thermoleophilaceae bacterium]
TDTDGVHTADPARDSSAQLIPEVTSFSQLEGLDIGFSASPLGSGGMRSKVVAAEMATAAGIPATIARGTDPGAVRAALAGQAAGTRFAPQSGRVSSFKLWLRYAKPTHGALAVDEGAERALRERGTSLLPVGIVGSRATSALVMRSRCAPVPPVPGPGRSARASSTTPPGSCAASRA